jgi:hypothetical protein
MDWLDNIKKELEVSKNHPIRKKRDWEIERDIRLKEQSKEGGKISGKLNVESGHLASIRSKESSSKGGKIAGKHTSPNGGRIGGKIGGKTQGNRNVQSGHLASISHLGGKITGPLLGRKAVESGHLARVRPLSGKISCAKVYTCPHCNKTGKGPIMLRHHFDRCKQNPTLFLNI